MTAQIYQLVTARQITPYQRPQAAAQKSAAEVVWLEARTTVKRRPLVIKRLGKKMPLAS